MTNAWLERSYYCVSPPPLSCVPNENTQACDVWLPFSGAGLCHDSCVSHNCLSLWSEPPLREDKYLEAFMMALETSITQSSLIRSAMIAVLHDINSIKWCVCPLHPFPLPLLLPVDGSVQFWPAPALPCLGAGCKGVTEGWRGGYSADDLRSATKLSMRRSPAETHRRYTIGFCRDLQAHAEPIRSQRCFTDPHGDIGENDDILQRTRSRSHEEPGERTNEVLYPTHHMTTRLRVAVSRRTCAFSRWAGLDGLGTMEMLLQRRERLYVWSSVLPRAFSNWLNEMINTK